MARNVGDTIACEACASENPAGARFCTQCGTALPLVCPACGSKNRQGVKFCGHCGARLGGVATEDLASQIQIVEEPTPSREPVTQHALEGLIEIVDEPPQQVVMAEPVDECIEVAELQAQDQREPTDLKCPVCQTVNVPGATYCDGCGAVVAPSGASCPACGLLAPRGSLFCDRCGERLGMQPA